VKVHVYSNDRHQGCVPALLVACQVGPPQAAPPVASRAYLPSVPVAQSTLPPLVPVYSTKFPSFCITIL
jgi:hypothetical protein